ncbi:hypothetical protein HDV05_005221 [Chytridiales sp. JEL 0842]|nr:hypothetical protein HDV05_005221 [Chytridiales sp. JEL 0842]
MASQGCYNFDGLGRLPSLAFFGLGPCENYCTAQRTFTTDIIGFGVLFAANSGALGEICICPTAASLRSISNNGCGPCPFSGVQCGERRGNRETVFFTPLDAGGVGSPSGSGSGDPSSISFTRTIISSPVTATLQPSITSLTRFTLPPPRSTVSLVIPTAVPTPLNPFNPSSGPAPTSRIPTAPSLPRPAATSDTSSSDVLGGASPALIGTLSGIGAAIVISIVCVWIFVVAPRRRRERKLKQAGASADLEFPSSVFASAPAPAKKDTPATSSLTTIQPQKPLPTQPLPLLPPQQQQQQQWGYYPDPAQQQLATYASYTPEQQAAYYAAMYAPQPQQQQPQLSQEGPQMQFTQQAYVQPPEVMRAVDPTDQTAEQYQQVEPGGEVGGYEQQQQQQGYQQYQMELYQQQVQHNLVGETVDIYDHASHKLY